MSQFSLTLAPASPQTRVLLTPSSKEILPVIRLPLSQVRHQQAPTLSNKLNHKLPGVWSADEPVGSWCLGRSNDLGDGVDHLELSPALDQ